MIVLIFRVIKISLSQIQHDLLGAEEEGLTAEVAETWEEESSFAPAAETFEFEAAAEPTVVQSVSEDALWTQAEPIKKQLQMRQKKTCSKGIADILKAEGSTSQSCSGSFRLQMRQKKICFQKITDILKLRKR